MGQVSVVAGGRSDWSTELDDDAYGVNNCNRGYDLESVRLLCETGTGKPSDR